MGKNKKKGKRAEDDRALDEEKEEEPEDEEDDPDSDPGKETKAAEQPVQPDPQESGKKNSERVAKVFYEYMLKSAAKGLADPMDVLLQEQNDEKASREAKQDGIRTPDAVQDDQKLEDDGHKSKKKKKQEVDLADISPAITKKKKRKDKKHKRKDRADNLEPEEGEGEK